MTINGIVFDLSKMHREAAHSLPIRNSIATVASQWEERGPLRRSVVSCSSRVGSGLPIVDVVSPAVSACSRSLVRRRR